MCVFVCLSACLANLPDLIIQPQKSIDAKYLICAAGNHNFVGFKEIHYFHVWNTARSQGINSFNNVGNIFTRHLSRIHLLEWIFATFINLAIQD